VAGPAGSGYAATTTSSFAIGLGSVTVATQIGLAYSVGARARLASYSAPTNWIEGQVTAYDGSGNLTVTADLANGTGTFANWTINVAGVRGQQGPQGAAGSGAGDMLNSDNLAYLTDFPAARNNLQLAAVAHTGAYSDLSGTPKPPMQRSVTASPISVVAGDDILNCNIATAATCQLPAASTRAGRPIIFKDVGGQFAAHNLVITFSGAEKADNIASLTLSNNYGYLRLMPLNDGVNSGWSIQ
jgi:hypothetical protein